MARPIVDHVVDGMQTCRRCEINKSVDQFHKSLTKHSGLSQYCKICTNLNRKETRYRVKDGTIKFIRGSMNSIKGTQEYVNHQKNGTLRRSYNMTLKDYNKLFSDQKGCCAICETHQSELKKALHVDHDHTTDKVRGLLCHRCNMNLGNFKDSINVLYSAIEYLKKQERINLLESQNPN